MHNVTEFINTVKTEGIEVEYLRLPIVSLSFDCMVRMTKPFATVLDREPIRITALLQHPETNYEEILKKECSKKYVQMMKEANIDIDGDIPVKLVELDLVRK
jgi:hypothetical protein